MNIVNAGFMTVGGGLVAAIQAGGASIAQVLLGLAVLNAVAAWLMLKYLPTNAFRDFVSILFRAFHRLEVEGLDNLKAAGPAPILALNHVSFLDGPLALTLTDEEPVFAIDHTIAQAWWVKPFLKLDARPAAQSGQADVDPHADQDRAGRRSAGHLPRGPHHRHRRPDEGL